MTKLLIIEDNDDIQQILHDAMERAGWESVSAYSGTEGLRYFQEQPFDLILLDLMLPGMSGEKVLTHIRRSSRCPIIVISAKDAIQGKVEALQAGANDYLVKPFDLSELLARMEVCLRDAQPSGSDHPLIYQVENLCYDLTGHEATYAGQPLNLTPQEFKILGLLVKYPKRIFTKEEVYEYAWDDCYLPGDKTVHVHISNLRKKLKAASDHDWIETIWGIGYRLCIKKIS